MNLEFKTKEDVMDFFHNRHGFQKVHQICQSLISHQNVQAVEIEKIKRHLHKLKEEGYLLIKNEGEDIYHESFASTPERVMEFFSAQVNKEDEYAKMSNKELLEIIRKNENSHVSGSRFQKAKNELEIRHKQKLEAASSKKWYEKPLGIILLMVIGGLILGGISIWLGWSSGN